MDNTLYYGDNLDILQRYVKDVSVDLVYLDPPFNSNQNYNVLFKEQDGDRAASQIRAFEDTWTWDQEDEGVYDHVDVNEEKAVLGVLISMEAPTKPMQTEAVTAGFYESALWQKKYPKIQLLTIADLLGGKQIDMPPLRVVGATFKKAPKASQQAGEQDELGF